MDTFGLRIIASDKVFFNGRCKKLTIPAPDGEKGVLAHHENMVIAVVVGIARMESTEGEVTEIAVGTDFAEIVNNPCDTCSSIRRNARKILTCVMPENKGNMHKSGCGRNKAFRNITTRRHLLLGR